MPRKTPKDKSGRALGERAQKTRQRFLDATSKLLSERSILEISVTEIAREVDAGSSLFYHYFKDVEDAVLRLAEQATAQMPAIVQMIEGGIRADGGKPTGASAAGADRARTPTTNGRHTPQKHTIADTTWWRVSIDAHSPMAVQNASTTTTMI